MSEDRSEIVLVTGAARGIGAAIVREFASNGCAVIINYHSDSSREAAEALEREIKEEHGVPTMLIQCDVSNFDATKEMFDAILEEFGALDVLVNNAGITADGLLMRMKEDQFQRVIDTNLGGTFNCMRHAAPIMIKQRYGSIVNISSIVGVRGNAGQVNYSASKAGIIGMTKSAAKELGGRGITVNAIAPGFITTDMTANLSEKATEALTQNIALGQLGTPEDIAKAAFFLGVQATYITGQVLGVDGGMSL